jgi:hypothetical protein
MTRLTSHRIASMLFVPSFGYKIIIMGNQIWKYGTESIALNEGFRSLVFISHELALYEPLIHTLTFFQIAESCSGA